MRIARSLAVIAAASLVAISAGAQRLAVDLTGTWLFSVVTENGTGTPTVTLKQTGDSLTGTYESPRMGVLPIAGTVKERTFQFALSTAGGATLTFKGTVEGTDSLKGDVDFGGMGGATFTGTRKKSGN